MNTDQATPVCTDELLRERISKFTRAEELKEAGLYPYFRVIESDQDQR